jgi:hypothetical protein
MSDKKKRCGAQLGNLNAFKHGFYSSNINQLSNESLTNVSTGNVEEEIEVIRIMIARHLEMRVANPPSSSHETLTDLRVISFAVARLASLMRLQRNLPAEEDIAYSENWMEELMDDIISEQDDPHDPTDLIQ